ncbi:MULTISPECIES: hypothetical protein [unclassified Exiguobacterium]|uniref:hypothetical protein n=1 Tax=unclassified Exiguobacterium TaxID=2644629 RepID=UPI001BED244A|nr:MULTISPECIES: hypothetical protein [unclassified Exiguobacterium]
MVESRWGARDSVTCSPLFLCGNSYPYYQDKKEHKIKGLFQTLKLHKIISKGGEKMKIGKVVLTLADDKVVTLEATSWDRFIEDLNDDKTYIEQNIVELDGSGDTFLVMKNQIILAELIYEEK